MVPCDQGRFINIYELLNLRALTHLLLYKNLILQCMGNIFCVEYFPQNIFPIHWKMGSLLRSEDFRTLRFTSPSMFLKCPPDYMDLQVVHGC